MNLNDLKTKYDVDFSSEEDLLGRGNFAKVVKARDKATQSIVALKHINIREFN